MICSPTFEKAIQDQNKMIMVLRQLGLYIAWGKIEGPAQRVTYLGIQIDSIAMVLSLPPAKILKLILELQFWCGRCKGTLTQLCRLVGILIHCSQVMLGGGEVKYIYVLYF